MLLFSLLIAFNLFGVGCSGRVCLDGIAARGPVNGRGPSHAMGGTKSKLVSTEPGQTYPATVTIDPNIT